SYCLLSTLVHALISCTHVPLSTPTRLSSDLSAAIAMIKEAQTVHVYKQEQMDDIDTIVSLFSLDPSNAEELSHLGHGEHFLKIGDRKSTRLNSSQVSISYSVFCLNENKPVDH